MANLDQIVTQVSTLFQTLQDQLSSQSFSGIPLLNLTDTDIVDPLFEGIQNKVVEELQKAQQQAQAESKELAATAVREALYQALGSNGLNLLLDSNGDGNKTLEDIQLPPDPNSTQFQFKLGKEISKDVSFAEDVGISNLGFKLRGGATADITLSLEVKFGIKNPTSSDPAPSFFIDVSPTEDFKAEVTTQLKDAQGNPLSISGSLGFFEVTATNNVTPTDPGSGFSASFTADLTNSTNPENHQITLSALENNFTDLKIDPNLSADADLKFRVNTGINPGLGIDNGILPSLTLDLNLLDWNYDSGAPSLPKVELKNLGLDLGSFINGLTKPILGNIQAVTEPVAKVTERLTQRLLPFADFSLLDIAEIVSLVTEPSVVDDIQRVEKFVKQVNTIAELANGIPSDGVIPLGNFDWNGTTYQSTDPSNVSDSRLEDLKKQGGDAGIEFSILNDLKTHIPQLLLGQKIPVDFITYTTPILNLNIGGEFPPPPGIPVFGPIFLRFAAAAGASAQLKIGFDSQGLIDFRNSNFQKPEAILNGLYIGKPDGGNNLSLSGTIAAEAALSATIIELGVGGGLGLEINMSVKGEDGSDGTRVQEFISAPFCAFESSGALSAIIYALFKLNFGFFSFTKRINLVKKNIIEFDIANGCSEPRFDVENPKPVAELQKMLEEQGIIDRQAVDDEDPNDKITLTALSSASRQQDGELVRQDLKLEGLDPEPKSYNKVQIILIYGEQGNDLIEFLQVQVSGQLDGGEGDDILISGAGDDFLTGGSGNDVLDGGRRLDAENPDINTAIYSDSPQSLYIDLRPDAEGYGFAFDGYLDSSGLPYKDRLKNIQNIEGSNHNDFIHGNDANNNLLGGAGNDYLAGGNGDDVLLGGSGRRGDTLDGGEGEDTTTYFDSSRGVRLNLSDQSATLISPVDEQVMRLDANRGYDGDAEGDRLSNIENLHGSASDDVLVSSDGGKNIDAFWGNDIIFASGFETMLNGDQGIDWLSYQGATFGVQVSLINGSTPTGSKIEFAKTDKGEPTSNSSFEHLEGSNFDDPLLQGDDQNNIIKGLLGVDILEGLKGNDVLIGGAGADTLRGGDNSTLLQADSDCLKAGSDCLQAGGDTASYKTARSGVIANLALGGALGDAAGDVYQNVENLLGSDYSDILAGDDGNNDINPGGRDLDLAGSLLDIADGGAGRDRLTVDYSAYDYDEYSGVTGGANTGTLIRTGSQPEIKDEIRLLNIERLFIVGTSKRDELYGASDNDVLFTGAGNDFISGGSGDDQIYTDDGNDVVNAEAGNDVVCVGLGSDQADGGEGNDKLIVNYSVRDTGSGITMSIDHRNATGDAKRTLKDNSDVLDSIEFSNFERYNITGTQQDDQLVGSNGQDTLIGGAGNDTLMGTNITFYNQPSGPIMLIEGETNQDVDTLTGGADRDRFILGDVAGSLYTESKDSDYAKITDFDPTEDVIVLYKCSTYDIVPSSNPELPGIHIYTTTDVDPSPDKIDFQLDDLIAVVQLVSGSPNLALGESYFELVGTCLI